VILDSQSTLIHGKAEKGLSFNLGSFSLFSTVVEKTRKYVLTDFDWSYESMDSRVAGDPTTSPLSSHTKTLHFNGNFSGEEGELKRPETVGKPLPAFTLEDTDEETVGISSIIALLVKGLKVFKYAPKLGLSIEGLLQFVF